MLLFTFYWLDEETREVEVAYGHPTTYEMVTSIRDVAEDDGCLLLPALLP